MKKYTLVIITCIIAVSSIIVFTGNKEKELDMSYANSIEENQNNRYELLGTFSEELVKKYGIKEFKESKPANFNGYIRKYKEDNEDDLINKSEDFILTEFGEPKYKIYHEDKSLWLYNIGSEDLTTMYIIIENGIVKDYKLDEFNMLDDEVIKYIFYNGF